jgi:tetratricopeptide (TPR) repeat protein
MSDEPYTPQKRVAELRVDRLNNKWSAWIIDVHFLDAKDLENESKNDVTVVDDTQNQPDSIEQEEASVDPVKQENKITDPAERERIRKQNEIIRSNIAFRSLKDSGDFAFNNHNYIIAYRFYNEAEHITHDPNAGIHKSDVDYLQTMIRETRKNIDLANQSPEDKFKELMQKALVARNNRKYDEVLDLYNSALVIKPDDEATKAKKREITTWINNLSRMEAKYVSGKYKDAINDYDKAIKADPDNSDYYVGRGKCFEKTRDFKKAMNDYKKATELDENNLEAFKMKGALHEKQNALADALACYTVCATNDRSDIASFIKMADLNHAIGNDKAAIEALDKGMSFNKMSAALPHRKGELLYSSKKIKEAQDNFSQAIQLDSTNATYYFQRGLCRIDLKTIPEAGADFANARRFGIDSLSNKRVQQIGAVFYSEGLAQYNAGKTDAAIVSLNHAIIVDPYKDIYNYLRGEGYYRLKEYKNAVKDYSRAISLNPAFYDAYRQRGLAKYNQAEYAEALNDFNAAIKISPKVSPTYKYLGDAYLELKEYKNAIAGYDASLAVARANKVSLVDSFLAELYNGRGEAYYNSGNFQSALDNFGSAVKSNRNSGELYFNRGKTYLALNEPGNAEEDLVKAVGYESKNILWNYTLAQVYQQKQKYDKAVELYNNVLATDVKQTLALKPVYKRAECYIGLNNFSEAIKDYKTIQSKNGDKDYPDFNSELGNIYLEINQPDSALLYFNKTGGDSENVQSVYGRSIAYLQKKQLDESFSWLDKALASGKLPKSTVSKDKRLAGLREDKRYKALIKKYY